MYGAVISAITATYWRESPVGVAAIAVLCAGDGFADIIGRRYGEHNKLPHSPSKVDHFALHLLLRLYVLGGTIGYV